MSDVSDRRTAILDAACRVVARRGVRGLRVEELAQEAGVSLGLVYYYFRDRDGLLRNTLQFVNERATDYTERAAAAAANAREELELILLLELQDDPAVLENSTAWGELRASAVFETELQDQLRRTTEEWNRAVAEVIERARAEGAAAQDVDPAVAAERLTALVEGISGRWLSGSISLEHARAALRGGIARELDAGRGALIADG